MKVKKSKEIHKDIIVWLEIFKGMIGVEYSSCK